MRTCLDCKYQVKCHDSYMDDGMFYVSCAKGQNWITPNAASYCEERPKGEWLHENDDHYDWYVCSHCGYGDEGEITDTLSAYCPNCGADMR